LTFIILPMESVTMTIVFPFGTYLSKRLNGRIQMIIGCVIGLVSIFASSFMKNFWGFFFLYGAGFGICNGIAVSVQILMVSVYCAYI